QVGGEGDEQRRAEGHGGIRLRGSGRVWTKAAATENSLWPWGGWLRRPLSRLRERVGVRAGAAEPAPARLRRAHVHLRPLPHTRGKERGPPGQVAGEGWGEGRNRSAIPTRLGRAPTRLRHLPPQVGEGKRAPSPACGRGLG